MIEMVAYILLAHVSTPDFALNEASVNKLVHWLSRQRNAFGGFASTQVTSWGKSWEKEGDTVPGVMCTSLMCVSL